MFDSLSDRLSDVFRKLGGRARLDDAGIQDGLREVRLALLEADVNLRVVREFTEKMRERLLGLEVARHLNPVQQVIKGVHEELTTLLGGEDRGLDLSGPDPRVIMMVGLQGSGKTTSTGKLALYLRGRGRRPYLAPADVYRPAAIEQLTALARQLNMPVYPSSVLMNPADIAAAAVEEARIAGQDVVLLDTAGRLHIDADLMQELVTIKERVRPAEILLVADAMTGQDAVSVAEAFAGALDITGVVLTKMDGDARGGAALSIKSVTGRNIKFVGVGERLTELEPFHPERMAGRILGMGDMLSLMEKAEESIEQEEAEELADKLRRAAFDLEDFRLQMRRLKSLGPLEGLLSLVPGMGGLKKALGGAGLHEQEMARSEAIINSMTPQERRCPEIITASRRRRIALGCGMQPADVHRLLRQFEDMRGMMKKMSSGGGRGMPRLPGGLGSMGGPPWSGPQAAGGGGGVSAEEQKKLRQKRKEERQRKKRQRR
ncbi:MAG: signal recognition particle protein [Desulfovibrio sp.]|jgi:signal recognition particle subunit SRP54|nr:signal recognition particle protein [Desulfovibrio sp.]